MNPKSTLLRQLNLNKYYYWSLLGSLLLLIACANGRLGGDWAVPQNQIAEGEGHGDIPDINQPKFTPASEVNYLSDSSIVLGIKLENVIKAYPLEIMDWHEIVNDQFGELPVSITYSALSGSSIALDRRLRSRVLAFRVSGLLHNSNTILHEFDTFTDWSQMLRKGIRGAFVDEKLVTYPVFEMAWGQWRQLFPESLVLNLDTGYNRPYGTYPYGDYRTDSTKILFTLPERIEVINEIYPAKEKMLGVIVNNSVKGFRFRHFSDMGFSLIQEEVDGQPIVVIGNATSKAMFAYAAQVEGGPPLQFSVVNDTTEVLLMDNEGNHWNLFGESIENEGLRLRTLEANIAYWLTWRTFYPAIEVYNP